MQLIVCWFRQDKAAGRSEDKEVMAMEKGTAISLYEGKRILWQGKPGCSWRNLVKPSDILKVPIGLLFFLFALSWEGAALSVPGLWGLVAPLFGLPFIAAGAYCSVGRFVHRRWQRRQIAYVLTSERILTVYRSRLVCRFYYTLRYLEKRENGDGSGTILFDKRPVDWHDFHFAFFYELIREREYEYAAIDDVDAVWALIEAQRCRWRKPSAK